MIIATENKKAIHYIIPPTLECVNLSFQWVLCQSCCYEIVINFAKKPLVQNLIVRTLFRPKKIFSSFWAEEQLLH